LINNVLLNKKYVLIDNRTQKEFQGATPYGSDRGGHIPNAKHIHWPDFFKINGTLKSTIDLSHLLQSAGVRSDQEVIVYCTGGVRSAMAYFVFRYLGFKVRNYDGSWWDWSKDSNLPIETSG
jgi:thiosulfate/3-mercaptopyruvate sulfurtransferase